MWCLAGSARPIAPRRRCICTVERRRSVRRHAIHVPNLHEALQHLATVAQIPTNAATASNVGQNASLLPSLQEVGNPVRDATYPVT